MTSLTQPAIATAATPPPGGWTALIDDLCEGRWLNPRTGEPAPRPPFDALVIDENLDGAEADLVARLQPQGEIAVVADAATWDAMGGRVARALAPRFGPVREVILPGSPHADLGEAARLAERLDGAGFAVAVGCTTSDTIWPCFAGLLDHRQDKPVRSGCAPGTASGTVYCPDFICVSAQASPPPENIA